MSERNPMYQHPDWDLPGTPKALIGAEPVPEVTPAAEPTLANAPRPEADPDKPLDIPSLIRLFETDAYPMPEGAPLRIAVGKETSLTPFPQDEALEYRQETPEHIIFLRTSKAGEFTFSFTPTPPVAATQEPSPSPQRSAADRLPGSDESLHPASQEPSGQAKIPVPTHSPQDLPRDKENKERVVITGRVGREPTIKQIKTGLMAKFPVAEHQPNGSTTWRTIIAFGSKAEALQGTLTKGQHITVAGYPHSRETTTKSGQKRTVTEIYLAGLKHHK
jgi:single-strand DNA-binding protein